ncbi:YjiH family protein [Auritidibacter ignavus]|uniref:YjiH family protein n=1 Tax=Auritidibacter ignavus TaxID=678932 RepID=UPI002447C691|nr:YjiH family protein [Auritidibacter ignavus]WGH82428.1 YjiH family protein [Auritidibacter ignavus]
MTVHSETSETQHTHTAGNAFRVIFYSALGIFIFFVPLTINGESSILIEHIVSWFTDWLGQAVPYIILALTVAGAVLTVIQGKWMTNVVDAVFAVFAVLGALFSAMVVFDFGPNWIIGEDIAPSIFNPVASQVGILVPIGAIFLVLLTNYGLMEFIGVYAQPIMRPVWRTPGRSAVDAVASFVASYSVSMLITDRMYKKGRYTGREAAIIAVGFSTVSVTFMVVIARTLDLMDMWLWYFFLSLIVTFLVTAIVVRIPPLGTIPNTAYPNVELETESIVKKNKTKVAWSEALAIADAAPNIFVNLGTNFLTGLRMATNIVPSIMGVGTVALILVHFTPIFDWLGYLLLPFTWIVGMSEPLLAAKASFLSVAEIFLPATFLSGDEDLALRLLIAVVSVSVIVFLSALIPTVMSTSIPISLWQMLVVWFERVVLTILIAGPLCHVVVMLQ